jgi:hypothetical protein
MKKVRLELTPHEAATLNYVLAGEVMDADGDHLRTLNRIDHKLELARQS